MTASRHRARGFTLIELLLATGMVAMLTLSLYAGLSTAFKARMIVQNQTDTLRQAKVALDLLEQDFRSVLPPTGTFAGPFIGTAGGASGAAAANVDLYCLGADFLIAVDGNLHDGMRHVQLSLAADGTANVLTRTITRNPFDATATPETETLAKNVTSFNARYFDGQNWNDAWDSTALTNAALPLAVELSISVKQPTTDGSEKLYTLTRIVTLPCGQTADQAAAVAAASSSATSTGDTATGTDTGTGTTGGTTP